MKMDKILLGAVILLCILGMIMIYSASSVWSLYKFQDAFHYVKYQGIFFILGMILLLGISKIPISFFYKKTNLLLLGTTLLLILVLIPGIGTMRNGSRSWFGIGGLGIQPSELAKLSLILFVSKYLSHSEKEIHLFWKGIFPIILFPLIIFGLIMLQPDFGTGFIMMGSIIALLFVAGAPLKLFIIGGGFGILGIIGLILIAPYRMNRITSFLNPWKDPLGTGFQMIQSLYAIGPSGLLGTGYLNSIQKHFYLPEPQTDFIFSIIVEEFGIVGALIVVLLFGTILIKGIKISMYAKDSFSKYVSFGMTFQILFQASLNLMVVVGLIPVTGVTLPFLSYGGSSLLISMISMGILLSISRNNNEIIE